MVQAGIVAALPHYSDGWIMRRVIVIAVAGFGLAGCSSFSMDYFKSAPPTVQVQLESIPSGADARTSVGPGCKTPCSVAVPAPDAGFTVTFTMKGFQPVTVPVQVVRMQEDYTMPALTAVDPNPVVVELPPAAPPPRAGRPRPKKPKPPREAAAPPPPPPQQPLARGAPPPPNTASPFPPLPSR